ncbi:hypothetical protein Sjap_004543 [Stephania japonica]|uniref:Uncharacterized protein n=1 Tax=Stephania japonica TaxID=461633 RepID=A0AAP0PKC2_9MAGN
MSHFRRWDPSSSPSECACVPPDEAVEGLEHFSPLNHSAGPSRSLVESRGPVWPLVNRSKGRLTLVNRVGGQSTLDQSTWLGGKFIFPPSTAVEGSTSSPPRPRPPPPSVASTRRRGSPAAGQEVAASLAGRLGGKSESGGVEGTTPLLKCDCDRGVPP